MPSLSRAVSSRDLKAESSDSVVASSAAACSRRRAGISFRRVLTESAHIVRPKPAPGGGLGHLKGEHFGLLQRATEILIGIHDLLLTLDLMVGCRRHIQEPVDRIKSALS